MMNVWVTTTDNPNDPFKDWDAWYDYDISHGYNLCGYVDRIAGINEASELPDEVVDNITENAIDDICRLDLTGVDGKKKKKVYRA